MNREIAKGRQVLILMFIDSKICPCVSSWRPRYNELQQMSIQVSLLFLDSKTSWSRLYYKEMKQNQPWDEGCMFSLCMKSVNIPLAAWLLGTCMWLLRFTSGWAKTFHSWKNATSVNRSKTNSKDSFLNPLHTKPQGTVWQKVDLWIVFVL
jgi:hypothetical protein